MLDAIVRSIVRTTMTGSQLLEWENAAQAELGSSKRSRLETYLWLPMVVCHGGCGPHLRIGGVCEPRGLGASFSPSDRLHVVALCRNAAECSGDTAQGPPEHAGSPFVAGVCASNVAIFRGFRMRIWRRRISGSSATARCCRTWPAFSTRCGRCNGSAATF